MHSLEESGSWNADSCLFCLSSRPAVHNVLLPGITVLIRKVCRLAFSPIVCKLYILFAFLDRLPAAGQAGNSKVASAKLISF
jgi:hypothetical protein